MTNALEDGAALPDAPAPDVARYAVIGSPIAHSRSPQIHAAFAEQLGHALTYQAVEVAPGEVASRVAELQAAGYLGLNVTVPHKLDAFALADSRTPRCELAGAANTLCLGSSKNGANGPVHADNTDGAGLVNDLTTNLGVVLRGARVLIVGAGGAAQGVVGPLLDAGVAELVIANRTECRAQALATRATAYLGDPSAGPDGQRVRAVPLAALGPGASGATRDGRPLGMDIVVNASASSLAGVAPDLDASVLAPGGTCYDMMYGPAAVPFLDWGRAAGAGRACDGLGMLVEQAAESFALWRGERPNGAAVLERLRETLA